MSDIKHIQGNFNEVPENWREITEGEFAQSWFFLYQPVAYEFRQIHPEDEPYYMSIRMFHMHDGTGFAIHSDYWAEKIRYFAFGCNHEWGGTLTDDEKNQIGIYSSTNVSKCKKCGYVWITDSSD